MNKRMKNYYESASIQNIACGRCNSLSATATVTHMQPFDIHLTQIS